MSAGYYIYYRVPQERQADAMRIVSALQKHVAKATGVRGQLLCRRDDTATWMEIYEGISDPAAFERVLAEAVSLSGFDALLVDGGQRVTEVFVPVTSASRFNVAS